MQIYVNYVFAHILNILYINSNNHKSRVLVSESYMEGPILSLKHHYGMALGCFLVWVELDV